MNQNANVYWDNHMHTRFSGDSEADELRMIRAAMDAGLSGITFTDHLDLDYGMEPHLFDLDLNAYAQRMCALREVYRGDGSFSVRFGIEIGLQPHLAAVHEQIAKEYYFDFVIGSVHQVDGIDPYYPAYFQRYSPEEGVRRYYEAVLENIDAWHGFDTLGHLDYILRYVPAEERAVLGDQPCPELIDAILDRLIQNGIALEVNTGGLRSSLHAANPAAWILERYRKMGGSLLTIGADAHKPSDAGAGIRQALEDLCDLGFSQIAIYKKRKAEPAAIAKE